MYTARYSRTSDYLEKVDFPRATPDVMSTETVTTHSLSFRLKALYIYIHTQTIITVMQTLPHVIYARDTSSI